MGQPYCVRQISASRVNKKKASKENNGMQKIPYYCNVYICPCHYFEHTSPLQQQDSLHNPLLSFWNQYLNHCQPVYLIQVQGLELSLLQVWCVVWDWAWVAPVEVLFLYLDRLDSFRMSWNIEKNNFNVHKYSHLMQVTEQKSSLWKFGRIATHLEHTIWWMGKWDYLDYLKWLLQL